MMKTIIYSVRLAAIFSIITYNSAARSSDFVDHIKLQYAGNVGLFSISAGIENRMFALDFLYGYAPSSVTGIDIHTIGIKSHLFPFSQIEILPSYLLTPLYAGASLIHIVNTRDPGYQLVNHHNELLSGIYFLPFIGVSLDKHITAIHTTGIYTEISTVNSYLESWFLNRDSIRFTEIFNIAFGLKYSF